MKITDPEVKKMLYKANSYELNEQVESWPDDEALRDGKSEMDVLKYELAWIIERFEDEGCTDYEALRDAREVINKANHGKPKYPGRKYEPHEISAAKDLVDEYKRLKRLNDKL